MKEKEKDNMKKISAFLIATIFLTACSVTAIESDNLMQDIQLEEVMIEEVDSLHNEMMNFSLSLIQNLKEDENVLISPYSIMSALAMTANGANKLTLREMEDVLGASIHDLNQFFYQYQSKLPEKDSQVFTIANSIWFRDRPDFTVKEDFLQTSKNFYDVSVYQAAFDSETKDEINLWVNESTDGKIEELLSEEIPDNVLMYLINAISFEAQWKEVYEESQIQQNIFNADQSDEMVDFMFSEENQFISMESATGFVKPYQDERYSFVALLPEGDVDEFINNLTGEELVDALQNTREELVHAYLPKFSIEYDTNLAKVLPELGMGTAFNEKIADFSNMASLQDGNLYISSVIHKTMMEVDQVGTVAAAVTAVTMAEGRALEEPIVKEVRLDRPFVYMIIDNETSLPLFMGVLDSVK